MNVLSVTNLLKIFPPRRSWWGRRIGEAFTAVNNISFSIGEGEILGLLGPNGAGKTTTIQMLLGTLTPTSGEISFFGKDFFAHRETILQQVGFSSSYSRFPAQLTVYENLDFYGRLYGLGYRERNKRIVQYLHEFQIFKLRDRATGGLSAGESARMMLVKAFLVQPRLVLLDEPTAALDPDVCRDVRSFVLAQQEQHNTSFLFTSHNMAEVSEVCDRILVLRDGSIIANDTPENLAATISTAHVELLITSGLEKVVAYVSENNLDHKVHNQWIETAIEEQRVAEFLEQLAIMGVKYSQIAVRTPQLEDYFVHIARHSGGGKQGSLS